MCGWPIWWRRFWGSSKKRHAPDTYRNYRFYGQKFAEACGQRLTADLKLFHVTQWVDQHPWNETSERNARRVAHRVMTWALEEGPISANPLAGMKSPRAKKRQRALTEEEFRIILAASHGRLRLFLWALRKTGAGPSELRRLTWDDVRADRWVLQAHKTDKKTRTARVIYLIPAMQRLMVCLRELSTSKYVFVNTRGLPWATNAIRLALGRIRDRCGLADDVCSYLIRHTFGTHAIMNGLNSSEVAELMGHTSTEMIDRVRFISPIKYTTCKMRSAGRIAYSPPIRSPKENHGRLIHRWDLSLFFPWTDG